jgi:hypothetical protein
MASAAQPQKAVETLGFVNVTIRVRFPPQIKKKVKRTSLLYALRETLSSGFLSRWERITVRVFVNKVYHKTYVLISKELI